MKTNKLTVKMNKSLVHAIFNCCVCNVSFENYLTAQNSARQHVEQTGHRVQGEIGFAVTYQTKTLPVLPKKLKILKF
jgi:hypothetical protein